MFYIPGKYLSVNTERFYLRSLNEKDATDTYVSWWNDPDVQEGLNAAPRNWTSEQAANHIGKFDNRNSFHIGIFCKEAKKIIGFFTMNINQSAKTASTNIIIGDKTYWGKHVVLEVRGRMLSFLFEEMKMEKVKGAILGRNIPSIFNYKAQGFKSEGVLRKDIPHFKEGRTEVYLFGLLKDEWQARQTS